MTSNFKSYHAGIFVLCLMLFTQLCSAQYDTEKWKLQLSFGANNPFEKNTPGYFSENINFITINLGVQHMFTNSMGAKLDVGYNRSASADGSIPFKLNYTRVNAQFVYDLFHLLNFLPDRINIVAHAGPGISFTKPLDQFSNNTYTFPNLMGGLELHYGISETLSVFGDLGYVYSLSNANDYDVAVDGFSFNNNLIYATIGLSVSLSGCFFCD